MNRHTEHDTCEHLLATGEQLCLHRGFTGMGLSELLKTAGVPKGSFYHYFRSKEAFGACMLDRHYACYLATLRQHFTQGAGTHRDRLLAWYEHNLTQFRHSGTLGNCLTVKLSAEVCDLSEDMRIALDRGASQVIGLLAETIDQAVTDNSLAAVEDSHALAQVLYALWLGGNLQAKISRSAAPLETTFRYIKTMLDVPA